MNKKRTDIEGILNTLSAIRKQLPQVASTPAGDTAAEAVSTLGQADAMEAFEMDTLASAIESLAGDLSASIEASQRKLLTNALSVYYTAEQLSKEPEHAHLIPYVEEMRASYRRDFGKEIPERG